MHILQFLTIAITLKVCEFLVLKFTKAPILLVVYPTKNEEKRDANLSLQINSITDRNYQYFYFQSNYNLPEVFWLTYYINHFNAIPKLNSVSEKPIFRYFMN